MNWETALTVRKLSENENFPYDLLLLADETVEAINKYLFNSEVYVSELKNIPIAVYVLQKVNEEIMEIKNIAVERSFQGKGIGSFLLRHATRTAMEKGIQKITIGTGDAAARQLSLYQKEGFKIFSVRKNFFIDNYPKPVYENGIQLIDMIMLQKELK